MYSDSQSTITTHIPLSDGGGGDRSFSFSLNTPTDSPKFLVEQKRFRKGDVNTSDGRLFWCYERDRRVDGSVHIRERWVAPQRFAELVERKRETDRAYTKGQAFKERAPKRKESQRRWSQSERGRIAEKVSRNKPENKAKRKAYLERAEVKARRNELRKRPETLQKDRKRYAALKGDKERYERRKAVSREWYRNNKDRAKELQRRWHERNPGRSNEYIKRRYAEDPQFALAYKVRARVYQAIQKGGASKTGRTEELVGCSFDFLRQHLERQFKGNMSWDNPGSFHIDHIVPLAALDLADPAQLKVACNWQNLRPISPKKNMSKGAKLTEPQLPLPLTVHSTTTYSL
jgi:hypothetical protein